MEAEQKSQSFRLASVVESQLGDDGFGSHLELQGSWLKMIRGIFAGFSLAPCPFSGIHLHFQKDT